MDIAAKRILITGGTSGLGLAMARALVGVGCQVAITGRYLESVVQVANSLGEGAIGVAMDVRDEVSITAGLELINSEFGSIDMLVNNAGLGMVSVNPKFMSNPEPFYRVSKDGFEGVFDTKVLGTFLVSKAVVPQMLNGSGGRVVIISMNTQTMERKGFIPYGPSGAAVEAMGRVMAADLVGSGVTVNLLLPGGASATSMIPPDVPDAIRSQLLSPEVMADPIVFLASYEASDLHDQRIVATSFEEWLTNFRKSRDQQNL
jgi:gluconate 5-dehydrogenase